MEFNDESEFSNLFQNFHKIHGNVQRSKSKPRLNDSCETYKEAETEEI